MNVEDGWDIISAYTRAQAIEDGVLHDCSELAAEAGFCLSVCVTNGVWSECVALTETARRMGCDERGRLWDVLMMARVAVRMAPEGTDRATFGVLCVRDKDEPETVPLWVHCGPGDDARPVITIMLEGED